ncbi:MAG: hypothetical protein ACYCV4_15415 [Dermatophilaceae bacterium]|jgi:hypothetical protein
MTALAYDGTATVGFMMRLPGTEGAERGDYAAYCSHCWMSDPMRWMLMDHRPISEREAALEYYDEGEPMTCESCGEVLA